MHLSVLARVTLLLLFLSVLPAGMRGAAMPADPAMRGQIARELGQRVRPLRETADLAPLLTWIGDRRAVLLGEASHGTQEYYQWRADLSRLLIEEKGFRFIAVEGDWGACIQVNRFVKHLPGGPATAVEALQAFQRWPQWMWNNQPTLELVQWMHDFNAGRPLHDRVGFYGIDVYGMNESLDKAVRHARKLSPEAAEIVAAAMACLEPYRDDMQPYLRRLIAQEGSCEAVLRQAAVYLEANRQALSRENPDAWFHAWQNTWVVKSAERHHRKMLFRDARSWNARAEHFHATFMRLLEHYGPDARGIVWAHNTHVGDARATQMAAQGLVNIGQLVREALGPSEVAIVGFGSLEGEVVAGRQWEAPRQVMPLPRAMPGSLEQLLYQVSDQPGLYLMDEVREVPHVDGFVGHRAVGVVYNPHQEQGNYVPTRWPQRYDAFIFLPRTMALQPVHHP